MVVDDEKDFLYEVRRMLETEGFEVMTASTAEEALKTLGERKPDLLLIDVMMPGMDGWRLGKKVREMEGFENTTIAMLTVKDTYDDKIVSLEECGADWHISKPIDRGRFIKTVRWLLERPPRRRE